MPAEDSSDPKDLLHHYLESARAAMVWKLDGLSEYDVRRPLTPTGTNLLGLVKHLGSVEFGYFGLVFGRPGEDLPWLAEDAEPNADMYATLDEDRDAVLAFYARARAHADATIAGLDLDAEGNVPWWGDANPVTLHWILVHMIAETNRHVGHADILREGLDGVVGLRDGNENLPDVPADFWPAYCERLEQIAADARRRRG